VYNRDLHGIDSCKWRKRAVGSRSGGGLRIGTGIEKCLSDLKK
jgi:hypothetical protein